MIQAIILCHPASADLLPRSAFNDSRVRHCRIACGTSRCDDIDYSESGDFFPTYASWNSVLFETSVILTVWEHADNLIGDNDVAILHSDINMNHECKDTWDKIEYWLSEDTDRSIGLSVPAIYMGMFDGWELPYEFPITVHKDPMLLHAFDNQIQVWDYIKKFDHDIYEWAMDVNPHMIYSHQFACSRKTFDYLGNKLYDIAHKLRLMECGFWTPHVFERLIALYLAQRNPEPVLSTAFWHHASSGTFGPGKYSLYGPRPFRFYRICTRANICDQ